MKRIVLVAICLSQILGFVQWVVAQQTVMLDRGYAQDMLQTISKDIRKHYYDEKFHGVDWDAAVAEAKQKIQKSDSMNMDLAIIAATLDKLNDSHLFFVPPEHSYRLEYGWQQEMVGDKCYVTRVRPNTDAEAKGLKAGDQILTVNGYMPTREDSWKIDYLFRILRPQPSLRLQVLEPNGVQRQMDITAKIKKGVVLTDLNNESQFLTLLTDEESDEERMKARSVDVGDDLMVLKLPEFVYTSAEVNSMRNRANKHKALIIDLRDDPGGSVDTLEYLVGSVFNKEVKIADRLGRKEMKPLIAKPRGDVFTGKLIVLVNSKSASAAELFARVVQLEKRGIVIGDRTSGSVMEAKEYQYQLGADVIIPYGASITEANLIMSDGKSLEHSGVIPDEIVLPTAGDIAAGRDPALAKAAEELGAKLSPEAAGKLFPYEWPQE
jgi:C-terminal processing protease CtpA/Prc